MRILGDIAYRAASVWQALAGNITATRKFLSQTGTGAVSAAPSWDQVTDADLSTSDITTNNVTIAKHGFTPKLPNDATKYLDGTGGYTVPPGTGGSGINQLTGDVTAGPGTGSQAATIANTGATAGTFGSATKSFVATVNAKGQITASSETTITDTGITQLTGDVTAGPGSGSQAATLTNTAVTPGSYTNANVTFDSKGRATAASNGSAGSGTVTTTGSPATGNLSKFSGATSITNADLTGDVTTSGGVATTLANSGATAGTFGSATKSFVATVNAKGLVTASSEVTITGSGGVTKLFDSTLGGDAATIDTGASGIAGGYDVLEVWMILRTDEAVTVAVPLITFNNDGGANYDHQRVTGANNTASAGNASAATSLAVVCPGNSATAGVAGVVRMTIPGYTQTTFNKSVEYTVGTPDQTAANRRVDLFAGEWRNTAAITRMAVTASGATKFRTGSRMIIYGR